MYDKLAHVIAQSGIWDGERKESHKFLLSPSVYYITTEKQKELTSLGHALYECLEGLSHIAVIAHDQKLNYGGTWMLIRKVFSTGVPKVYQELQGMNIKHIPRLLKVDLMVDQDENLKIAEIDGHNKHGIGYSTLCSQFRRALRPHAKGLPGTVKTLADEIKRLGHKEVKLFYSDRERFYIPEFEIAQQEFREYGIVCHVVSEVEADEEFTESGLFLDLPFLHRRKHLYAHIIRAYEAGDMDFIIPPKPFLGAKGALALLRNDGGHEQLEAILNSFIKKQSLELIRSYTPKTLLVGKQANKFGSATECLSFGRHVLKESISSGMKGTIFSDDPDFDSVLAQAQKTHMNWILQEEVVNKPQPFSWFEREGDYSPVLKTDDGWFMRVIAQYVNRKLADVVITARRDKSVHGAKDCIQLGTIVL